MNWISVNPAKGTAGIAFWQDHVLLATAIIKARGSKGKFYMGDEIHESRADAWISAMLGQEYIIMEQGRGGRLNVAEAQGYIRGFVNDLNAAHAKLGACIDVFNVNEWRRVVKDATNTSWPRDSARCKALAQKIVKEFYGIDVSEDEADAVLVGHAAIRTRMVPMEREAAQ